MKGSLNLTNLGVSPLIIKIRKGSIEILYVQQKTEKT